MWFCEGAAPVYSVILFQKKAGQALNVLIPSHNLLTIFLIPVSSLLICRQTILSFRPDIQL
jgi:hypothetical protein